MQNNHSGPPPNHHISLLLNEPLNYDRMLEISTDELEFLKIECDSVMRDIKDQIIREYENIKPILVRMRDLKHKLRQLKEKREIYKTFISIDKNQSLLSSSSVSSVDVKPITFSELFRDIENDKLLDGPPSPPVPTARAPIPEMKRLPTQNKIVVPEPNRGRSETKKVLSAVKKAVAGPYHTGNNTPAGPAKTGSAPSSAPVSGAVPKLNFGASKASLQSRIPVLKGTPRPT